MSLADHPKSADVKPGLAKGPKQPQTAQSVSAGSQSLFLSVFDLFKIGIGPSSSHTMGPMTAAARFLDEIAGDDWPRPAGVEVARISVSLHGSLAYTGIGHGTDRAVILGLAGETPQTVDPDKADGIVAGIAAAKRIAPSGHPGYRFDPGKDLLLDKKTPLLGHANGMAFSAYDADDRLLLKRIYYSIGGGFVVSEEELQRLKSKGPDKSSTRVPHPFKNAAEMLAMAKKSGLSIAEMKRANEEVHMAREKLDEGLDAIWGAMLGCIERGLSQDGIMPGGLKVRRARALHDKLNEDWRTNRPNPARNDWLSIYAMAVNEENAAGGRVVTAPTNGAAGTLPAAALLAAFPPGSDQESIRDFLLTAARSAASSRQTPRSPAPRWAARAGGLGLGDGGGGSAPSWAVRPSRSRTQPRSRWSIISV